MSWPASLLIGSIVALVALLILTWRRPLRSFRWSQLDTIDLSAGLLADQAIVYYRGEEIAATVRLEIGDRPPIDSLKLVGIRIWNSGLRTIEESDFLEKISVFVPMTDLIGLVSVTPLRDDMAIPAYEPGFPIRISPFRLRSGDGVEIRVLAGRGGYARVDDGFTSLNVREVDTAPRHSLLFWLGIAAWWRRNMDIRAARIIEGLIIGVVVALVLRLF